MLRLTDKEILALGSRTCEVGNRTQEGEIAKAQLKKALEYLDKRSFSFQPDRESAVWVISCDKRALFKEVEQ